MSSQAVDSRRLPDPGRLEPRRALAHHHARLDVLLPRPGQQCLRPGRDQVRLSRHHRRALCLLFIAVDEADEGTPVLLLSLPPLDAPCPPRAQGPTPRPPSSSSSSTASSRSRAPTLASSTRRASRTTLSLSMSSSTVRPWLTGLASCAGAARTRPDRSVTVSRSQRSLTLATLRTRRSTPSRCTSRPRALSQTWRSCVPRNGPDSQRAPS